MNFTYDIRPPTDGGKWGHVTRNGKEFSGIVGDVMVMSSSLTFLLKLTLLFTKE